MEKNRPNRPVVKKVKMGNIIYLQRFGVDYSSEAEGFVLAYVPIDRDLTAGERPVHEYGLPHFGLPHPNAHGWVDEPENSQLAQHRADTSRLLPDS